MNQKTILWVAAIVGALVLWRLLARKGTAPQTSNVPSLPGREAPQTLNIAGIGHAVEVAL